MSRSRPNDNAPNPAVRWFDWHGEKGLIRYYDKEKKETVDVPLPFTAIVLDQLSAVRGWDDSTKSGIFSNAVRDTRSELLTVKSFKGGIIAEGHYKQIKAQVNAAGGHFETQVYIAFPHQGGLAIGVLSFKGAALGAWMEFSRAHRAQLNTEAVRIASYTEGQKGRVIFRTPVFTLAPVKPETDKAAVALDAELQAWLDAYFAKNNKSAPPADDSGEPTTAGADAAPVAAGNWTDEPGPTWADLEEPF